MVSWTQVLGGFTGIRRQRAVCAQVSIFDEMPRFGVSRRSRNDVAGLILHLLLCSVEHLWRIKGEGIRKHHRVKSGTISEGGEKVRRIQRCQGSADLLRG